MILLVNGGAGSGVNELTTSDYIHSKTMSPLSPGSVCLTPDDFTRQWEAVKESVGSLKVTDFPYK